MSRLIRKNYFDCTMKYRAVLLSAVLFGSFFVTSVSRAGFSAPPRNLPGGARQYNPMGPDIAESGFKDWQAPDATVNPESLIPSDGSVSNAPGALTGIRPGPIRTDSAQLAKLFDAGGTVPLEGSKPIEKVEAHSAHALLDESAVPAPAPPHHETKRIMQIGGVCLALLAFRKFRKLLAGPSVQKPSFL